MSIFRRRIVPVTAMILVPCFFNALAAEIKIFDQSKKILIHTTDSINPGKYLEDWLERYFGTENIPITIVKTGGRYSGVDTTADGGYEVSDDNNASFLRNAESEIADARDLTGCSDCPVIYIANGGIGWQSYIADPEKSEQVDRIVGEMEFMCSKLAEAGADIVFPGTYHYNYSHRCYAENEPVAVRKFNERNTEYRAIDLVTPTMAKFPLTSVGDQRHPTELTWKMYAYNWMKAMLEHDGLPMPEWADQELAAAEEEVRQARSNITLIEPQGGKYAVGDTIEIEWETDCDQINSVMLELQFRRMDHSLLRKPDPHKQFRLIPNGVGEGGSRSAGTIECVDPTYAPWGWGKYKFVITEDFVSDRYFSDYEGMALPFYLTVSTPELWHDQWDHSVIDWQNPENMIVVYPSTEIDESMPIYPGIEVVGAKHTEPATRLAPKETGCISRLGGGKYRIHAQGASAVTLYDCRGGMVLQKPVVDGTATIDLTQAPGAYIAQVKTENGQLLSAVSFTAIR